MTRASCRTDDKGVWATRRVLEVFWKCEIREFILIRLTVCFLIVHIHAWALARERVCVCVFVFSLLPFTLSTSNASPSTIFLFIYSYLYCHISGRKPLRQLLQGTIHPIRYPVKSKLKAYLFFKNTFASPCIHPYTFSHLSFFPRFVSLHRAQKQNTHLSPKDTLLNIAHPVHTFNPQLTSCLNIPNGIPSTTANPRHIPHLQVVFPSTALAPTRKKWEKGMLKGRRGWCTWCIYRRVPTWNVWDGRGIGDRERDMLYPDM